MFKKFLLTTIIGTAAFSSLALSNALDDDQFDRKSNNIIKHIDKIYNNRSSNEEEIKKLSFIIQYKEQRIDFFNNQIIENMNKKNSKEKIDFFLTRITDLESEIKSLTAVLENLNISLLDQHNQQSISFLVKDENFSKLDLKEEKNHQEKFGSELSKDISVHFNKAYKYTPKQLFGIREKILGAFKKDIIKRNIDGMNYKVFRRKHGLAHGVRQGFLASDIIDACVAMSKKETLSTNSEISGFLNWISNKTKSDPNFQKKVEIAASFQRTGRESEASSSGKYAEDYKQYERQDRINFLKSKLVNNLFKDEKELAIYSESMLWATANEGKIKEENSEDLKYLRKLMHASHTLDLRRIMHFGGDRIKTEAAEQLFGDQVVNKSSWSVTDQQVDNLINNLWERSGEYLEAVGDTDLYKKKGIKYKKISDAYQDKFYILNNNPEKLFEALSKAKENSKVVF